MNTSEFKPTWVVGRVFSIALLVAIYAMVVRLNPAARVPGEPSEISLAMGFLLLVAFLAGQLAQYVKLPKITGYLLCGLFIGPEVANLITAQQLSNLDLINRLAIGIIAFIAGGELRPSMLRERGRTITVMLLIEIAAVFTGVGGALFLLRPFIPFLADVDPLSAFVLVALFASIATIHSPAVTIALLNEQKPKGPVTSTTLGIVVAADVVVVLLATGALAVAKAVIDTETGFSAAFLGTLAWELIGAIVAGAVLGVLVDVYLRQVKSHYPLFVIGLTFLAVLISAEIHVEYMLFMLSAGFFVENVSPIDGEPLLLAFEKVSVPAYALFFALAGASIHLDELQALWPIALAVVAVRALGLWAGCRIGARVARAEPAVARYTWLGLISQAGVALGLVTVVAQTLPEVGEGMLTLFLAMIAIHEIVGPIAFRSALIRSGEAQQKSAPKPAPSSARIPA